MCEHCGDPSLSWETWIELDRPDDPTAQHGGELPNCEHSTPPPDDAEMTEQETIEWFEENSCYRTATWVHRSTGPVDHLCEEHKADKKAYLVEEHGEVPEPIGLEDTDLFLPVKQQEPCERMVGVEGHCGEPSAWLMLGTFDTYYCDRHRTEHGSRR